MRISIIMEALTGRFETDTNRASKSFSRNMKSMERDAARFAKRAFISISAAATTALVFLRGQAKGISELAKAADALKIDTGDLQALHIVAEKAGVSTEEFDKRLGRLQNTLGEIARHGGMLSKVMTDLGLDINEVINLPTDKQFEAVARALASIENPALRASIATDLFRRDANRMLLVADQLAKNGIAGIRKELEALGLLITRKEAAGVERMNGAIRDATKASQAFAQRLTIELAPGITAVAEAFLDAARQTGGFKEEAKDAADKTVRVMGILADSVDTTGRLFRILANTGIISFEFLKVGASDFADTIINGPNRAVNLLLRNLSKLSLVPGFSGFSGLNAEDAFQFGDITGAFKTDIELSNGIIKEALAEIDAILMAPLPSTGLEERLKKIREELKNFKAPSVSPGKGITVMDPEEEKRIDKVSDALNALMQQVKEFGLSKEDTAVLQIIDLGATEDQIMKARQIADEIRLLGEDEERRKDTIAERNDLEREYASLVESLRTPLEAHVDQINRTAELYALGVIPNVEEYAKTITRVTEAFDKSKEKVTELDEFTKQAARNAQTAFADFLFDPFDEGLKGMLRGFSATIRRMVAEAAAAQILKSLFGSLEGSQNGFLSSLGKAFGGTRDHGGRGQPGQVFAIGRGAQPELFIPDTPGTFVPNADRLAFAGGNTTNIFNIPPQPRRRSEKALAFEINEQQRLAAARNR